jgi:hypothetical protein
MRGLAAGLLLLGLADAALAGDPPPPPPPEIAGRDAASQLASAEALSSKDPHGLARALSALGASKTKEPAEFLREYCLKERSRALRLVALEALSRLDRKGAAEWFRARADGKEMLSTVTSLECLGHVGTKEDAAAVAPLLRNPDELIASAAATLIGRLGTSKDVAELVDAGLAHESPHVTEHAAWAIQDILKKPKSAAAAFEKIASKRSDPRSIRAGAAQAIIEDKLAEPFAWGESLESARDLVLAAPQTVEIRAINEEYKNNVLAGLDWLKKNLPAAELTVRASAKRIDVPSKVQPQDFLDLKDDAICVTLERASWPPHKMAFHLYWMSTVMWAKRTGEPYKGHRGWEPGLFDVYDVCVLAKLYDAGPGGLSRSRFVRDQIDKRPWGSQ